MSHIDPIARFHEAFAAAKATEEIDCTVVAFATVGPDGRPAVRYVLCKTVDERGFHFHTNFGSRKALELALQPFASLAFHWPKLAQQIRVEGKVSRLDDATSDAYFASRPRVSQLGAWASEQSRVLPSREHLERRLHELEQLYEGRPVPRPPNWGGLTLVPDRIEFWRAGEFRLHHRTRYVLDANGWRAEELYP